MLGPISVSILVISGICLHAAIHHLYWSAQHSYKRSELLFGGIALLAAFFAMTLIWSYQASSIAEVSSALTWNI
jgi:hypothetical protein